MGARSSGGSRLSNRGGGGSSLQGLAKSVEKAFYQKGVSDYINGDNSPEAVSAYSNYKVKMDAFKQAYDKATGGDGPAFGDWNGLVSDIASGDVKISPKSNTKRGTGSKTTAPSMQEMRAISKQLSAAQGAYRRAENKYLAERHHYYHTAEGERGIAEAKKAYFKAKDSLNAAKIKLDAAKFKFDVAHNAYRKG